MIQNNGTLNGVRCLVCENQAYRRKTLERSGIYQCGSCRLEFCHPMPGREELDAFYADYHDLRAAEPVVEANAARNFQKLQEYGLSRDSRLLDYGCGQGIFGRLGAAGRWDSYDPYKADKIDMPANGAYDWITLWGVLEHCPGPVSLLKQLSQRFRGGGHLALTTVWIDSGIPYQYKPPEHVSYWTQAALAAALAAADFEMLTFEPYRMVQKSDVYMQAVLRTVPQDYRERIHHDLPEMVEVPTNEAFITARRE
jgi:hypothetical protein